MEPCRCRDFEEQRVRLNLGTRLAKLSLSRLNVYSSAGPRDIGTAH